MRNIVLDIHIYCAVADYVAAKKISHKVALAATAIVSQKAISSKYTARLI